MIKLYRSLVIISIFIFSSCGLVQKELNPFDPLHAYFDSSYDLVHADVPRGHMKRVMVPRPQIENEAIESFSKNIFCNDKEVGFERNRDQLALYISAPYEHDEDIFSCHFRYSLKGDQEFYEYPFMQVLISPYEFESERLNVDRRHVELSEEDLERWQNERKELERVYSELEVDKSYFSKSFERPLNSVITSTYGRERVFNNDVSSWHNGIDFRAWYDTPIPSSNRGRVVFAGDLFFNGLTVIIDHGLGIVTLYCHLNELKVEVGDIVPQGHIIGLSGNTGRTTAPHLHWGVKVAGNWINGFSLTDTNL